MSRPHGPAWPDFFQNLGAPMPLPRKLWLIVRNNAIKVIRRQSCCGHHGEPGC